VAWEGAVMISVEEVGGDKQWGGLMTVVEREINIEQLGWVEDDGSPTLG